MNKNGEILQVLVDDDFGVLGRGRWLRSVDHSSLVIDKEKGVFYFNSQEIVGDPLVYLTKIRGMSFSDAKDYLKKFDYTGTHVWSVYKGGKEVIVFPELVDIFFEQGRTKEKRDYMYRRGITDEILDSFQIGWYNGYIMIPFFENGTFRNFQMRKDIPNKTIKSYYSEIGPLLFNGDILRLVDKVFIVEGPVDALVLIQNGIPAISTNFSGRVLTDWYGKFVKQKEIYIVFDNDDAGEKEAIQVAEVLGTSRCKIYTFGDFGEQKGYDPVDYFRDGRDADEFRELVEHNSKYLYQLVKKGEIKWTKKHSRRY